MSVRELAPGLWRWTAIHPEADPILSPGAPWDEPVLERAHDALAAALR